MIRILAKPPLSPEIATYGSWICVLIRRREAAGRAGTSMMADEGRKECAIDDT